MRELERRAEFPGVIAVKEAVVAYLADQRARKLSPPTLTPMRALLEKRFLPWCEARQLVRLDAVRTPQLKEFRCSWECTLLGHRSIKMTEKHYLPWVKARQKQLTASVRRA